MSARDQRTANETLRRKQYRRAHVIAESAIRNRYKSEHEEYVRLEAIMRPEVATRVRWNAAARHVVAEHREEFHEVLRPLYEQFLAEVGYAAAPRGGHATGRYAKEVPAPE